MKITPFILTLALPIIGGCAFTPTAPICSISKSTPGCDVKYYKYKESDYTRDAAFAICHNASLEAVRRDYVTGYSGSGRGIFTGPTAFKACMVEQGFLPCDQGGENVPECQ